MLPDNLLPLRIREGRAVVGYLSDGDQGWVRALIDELERHVGRPERELRQRLAEPLPLPSPLLQRRVAAAVLSRLWRSVTQAPISPKEVRRAVFDEMAAAASSRMDVLKRVGQRLGIAPATLSAALFADLPGERIVQSPGAVPTPTDAIRRINLTMAQAMLFRATSVRVRVEGQTRARMPVEEVRQSGAGSREVASFDAGTLERLDDRRFQPSDELRGEASLGNLYQGGHGGNVW